MAFNDMLIKLYNLEFDWSTIQAQAAKGVEIGKPIGPDRRRLLEWIAAHFPASWQGELERALCNTPISCFIAQRDSSLLGFSCYDATALGYFGPIGVIESARNSGTGTALAQACLLDMRLKGYGYAIVGMAGAREFYRKLADAMEIPDSAPGIYRYSTGKTPNSD